MKKNYRFTNKSIYIRKKNGWIYETKVNLDTKKKCIDLPNYLKN